MLGSTKTEVVIKDACILFDLIDLGVLAIFYELELVVVTTPSVLEEIEDETQLSEIHIYVDNGKLLIDYMGAIDFISEILDKNPGLSFTDASVVEAASRRNATVLSSDKSLRNESIRRGLTVRGVLWILEELHIKNLIDKGTFLGLLDKYPNINKRAPKQEIDKLINKYKT